MRPRLAKLIGLAAIGSLALTLLVAPPASAAPGDGTIAVTIVDDLGRPAAGAVILRDAAGGLPISLGVPEGGGPQPSATSFTEPVPPGTYGVAVIGGWGGITCVGFANCGALSLSAPSPTLTPQAVTIPADGVQAVTVVIGTPKLTGTGVVGSPLAVSVPATLSELGAYASSMSGGLFGGVSATPTIAWNRGGTPTGVTGLSYTVATADAGSTVSATVNFPPLLGLMMASLGGGVVPPPFTTSSVSVAKLTPAVTLDIPKKVKQGKRPTIFINLKYNGAPVKGTVSLSIKGQRTQQGVVRSGLVKFTLPKLKPGKHKVKVSFAGGGGYNPASVTKTVTVQKAKKPKKGKKR